MAGNGLGSRSGLTKGWVILRENFPNLLGHACENFAPIGGSCWWEMTIFTGYKTLAELRRLRDEKARDRRLRVHERQVQILGTLYARLEKVQVYSQLMTEPIMYSGQKREEYPALLSAAFSEARNEFMGARLFLPSGVVKQVESFFQIAMKCQMQLGFVSFAGIEGDKHADFWEEAATIAHREMPSLLGEIENKTREIIHGE